MSKINVILMHGKSTSPSKKWYPWLKQEMQKRNIKFDAPILPEPNDPVLDGWLDELSKLEINQNTILVGHSRGGVAILRFLEKQPLEFRVKKVILVAANSGSREKKGLALKSNNGFYTKEGYDFKKIKNHCQDVVILHSKDDEWVPYSAGVENAKGLGAKFLSFKDRGHFGSKLKKQEIPELLNEILNF